MSDIITLNKDYGEYGRAVFEIDQNTGEGTVTYFPNMPLERVFVTINLKEGDTMTEPKIHLIKDASIGGVEREFIEVERKASVGDYVVITGFEGDSINHVAKVTSVDDSIRQFEFIPEIPDEGCTADVFDYDYDKCVVLEPTDIVQIEGPDGLPTRYKLEERVAEVGEKVIITDVDDLNGDGYEEGHTFTVHGRWVARETGKTGVDDEISVSYFDSEYHVLVPVKPALSELLAKCTPENRHEEVFVGPTVDETQCSPQVLDMLANLARRVTQLESQLRDTQGNVENQARELAGVVHAVDVLENDVSVCIDDISALEGQSQPDKSAEEILQQIAELIEKGGAGQ